MSIRSLTLALSRIPTGTPIGLLLFGQNFGIEPAIYGPQT